MTRCWSAEGMPMSFRVVIPARYASVRLPGKPLVDICGQPMALLGAHRIAVNERRHRSDRGHR